DYYCCSYEASDTYIF
nr:immunoglobulin light chain junction region [Macaca mulatta]